MNRRRFTALIFLASLGLACTAGCGGGGTSTTIIVGIIPGTSQNLDAGSSLDFKATTANDTANSGAGAGVMWTVTGSGCAGDGCGTLTNVMPNSVTYTAPTGQTATLTISLKATSITNKNATATVSISVVLPPTFTTISLDGGTNGVQYSQTIVVTGGVAPLKFALAAGSNLPAGLSLSQTGTISGRPSGPFPPNPTLFNVTVTDNANPPIVVTSPQFSIAINAAPTLSVTQTSPLPPGTLNVAYATTIATSGGVRPFTWSILSGCLPTGLQLNSVSGRITGTPTNTTACSFTPQVVDSSIPPQTQASAGPLMISVNAPPALNVIGGPLGGGSVASPYTASVGISGGVPPYQNITVTSGLLPSGLTLNPTTGVISGVPILEGTSTFSVQVEDSATPPNVALTPANNPLQIAITQGTTDPNALLSGSYAFMFAGYDSAGSVVITGVFTANGAGKITSGIQDSNRQSATPNESLGATFTGSYTITPDGRGTMQISGTDSVGRPFSAGYRLALDSNGNARFHEDDSILTTPPPTATHGTGVFKLQQGSTFASTNLGGNYAFAFAGQDFNGKPAALVGTVHSDQFGTLSPGMADYNDAGTYNGLLPLLGNYSVISTNGRGQANLIFQAGQQPQVTLQFIFYFVSSTDLFFASIDPTDATHPRLAGEMIQQQPAVQFNATALAGPGVVTGSGLDTNASVFVGLLSPCNAGGVCLIYTENNGGTVQNPVAPFNNGTFTVASNGRVDFTTSAGTPTLGTRVVAAYLTGVSQGFIIGSDTAATVGLLEQQSGGTPNFSLASIQGSYALSAPVTTDSMVDNVVGQVTSNGSGTIVGTVDETQPDGTVNNGQSFTAGSAIVDAVKGQGTITTNTPPGVPTNLVFYIVSPGKFRAVSVDSPSTQHPEVLFFDH